MLTKFPLELGCTFLKYQWSEARAQGKLHQLLSPLHCKCLLEISHGIHLGISLMFLSRKLSGSSCRQRQLPASVCSQWFETGLSPAFQHPGWGLPASEASTGSSTGERDWLPCEAEAREENWDNKIWKIHRVTSVTLPKITAGVLRFHLQTTQSCKGWGGRSVRINVLDWQLLYLAYTHPAG